MDEMNQIDNLNSSNKNTDEIINKIQNSLERLQIAINNRQIINNINNKNNNQNKNLTIRKKTFESKNIQKKDYPTLAEENLSNLTKENNYPKSKNNLLFNTDKRFFERKTNQTRASNNPNLANKIIKTSENIIPKSTPGRINNYDKNSYNNYRNRFNKKYNSTNKKCLKCGNINPPRSKFCFNCGNFLNIISERPTANNDQGKILFNNYINDNPNIGINNNINNNLKESQINKPELLKRSNNNININTQIMNNIYADLNEIPNEDLINYKKLNDLYLFGDYLENELKASNDENVKLLEKYKAIKIQVHSLNQKNNKIKQNIEALTKKEKELDKINSELKNGFNFVQKKLGISENDNKEKINLLNDLELNNKKYVEIQNGYDREIEELKNKISLLVDSEKEESDEDDNMIKNLEDNIEKEKKDLEEKNMVYMLLIKKNELLNLEINNLAKEIELDLNEENEEENLNGEEEIKEDNNNKNDNNNNEIKEKENNIEANKEDKMIKGLDNIQTSESKNIDIENKDAIEQNEIKNDINEDNNVDKDNTKKEEKAKNENIQEKLDNNG